MLNDIDWHRLLLNNLPANFLLEVLFRTAVMFVFLLLVLRLAGKRGVKQLSIFEVVIIISLGSAAGDPMFYEDVGLLPALVVLMVVILLYRTVTWLTGKKVWFERLIEGRTQQLIEDGKFSVEKFKRESLAQDEFFLELRLKGVEHLGQVRDAYLETTGDISVFFYEDREVRPGLPITPSLFDAKTDVVHVPGHYACSNCGNTLKLEAGKHTCPICRNKKWVEAICTYRVL